MQPNLQHQQNSNSNSGAVLHCCYCCFADVHWSTDPHWREQDYLQPLINRHLIVDTEALNPIGVEKLDCYNMVMHILCIIKYSFTKYVTTTASPHLFHGCLFNPL